MRRSGCLGSAFFGSLELSVNSFNEPLALPHRKIHGLLIRKAHVIHEQESRLKKDFFIARRQAKKSWAPGATSLVIAQNSVGTPSKLTYQCLARFRR